MKKDHIKAFCLPLGVVVRSVFTVPPNGINGNELPKIRKALQNRMRAYTTGMVIDPAKFVC